MFLLADRAGYRPAQPGYSPSAWRVRTRLPALFGRGRAGTGQFPEPGQLGLQLPEMAPPEV
jgi:hypothetical protein